MPTQDQIDFTVSTLRNLLRDNQVRLQRSLQLRDQAHDEAGRGNENYRIVWLKESVGRVLDTLEDIAREFNDKHPNEVCTARDYCDILMSAVKTIVR